jgi:hypothetical protein
MDELANVTALYNEAKTEISQAKADKEELDELRELKSDIDRKDKQNAMIIENQVSGVQHCCPSPVKFLLDVLQASRLEQVGVLPGVLVPGVI